MAASLRPPIAIKIQPHVQHSNGHHQPSPPSPLARVAVHKNMYARQSADEDASPPCSSPSPLSLRTRHSGGAAAPAAANVSGRRNSLLDGIKEIMGRPRSGSVGVNSIPNHRRSVLEKQARQMVKVQVTGCTVSSVYDLRESNEDGGDFYDDECAFRRPRSNSSDFLILRKTSRPLSVDVIGLVDKQDDPYRQYLKAITCYDLAPHAGTVIMLDSRITVHKAFLALTEAAHPAALVWDAARCRIVHLVTQTDFLGVLLEDSPNVHLNTLDQCFQHQGDRSRVLATATANMRLLDVAQMFCEKRVHRIPIIENDNNVNDVLYLITLERILQAVHKQHRSLHFAPWMGRSVAKAAVGKWQDLKTVTKDSSLRDAVSLLLSEELSSVPVVERPNSLKPTDILCKADIVRLLATTKSEDPTNLYSTIMAATVQEALQSRDPHDNIDPPFCSFKDSVVSVMDKTLTHKDFRCIYALDDAGRLMGAISVSDLMRHVMAQRLRPPLTG